LHLLSVFVRFERWLRWVAQAAPQPRRRPAQDAADDFETNRAAMHALQAELRNVQETAAHRQRAIDQAIAAVACSLIASPRRPRRFCCVQYGASITFMACIADCTP
jgi:hypothetical protein